MQISSTTILSYTILILLSLIIQGSTDQISDCLKNGIGCKIDVSGNSIQFGDDQVINQLKEKFDNSGKIDIQDAIKNKQEINAGIFQKNSQGWFTPPASPGKRLLTSTNNQFQQINQGNQNHVVDNNYVYSLNGKDILTRKFTIHRVNGSTLTQVYMQQFDSPTYPLQLHAKNNFFALILTQSTTNLPNDIIIKVYSNLNGVVTLLRVYTKKGLYIGSREYNGQLLVFIQTQMTGVGTNGEYKWTISGVGEVNQKVFQGVSGDYTNNYVANAARSVARIPLSLPLYQDYRLATYIFCDYGWNFMLSPSLQIYFAGNYFNPGQGTTTIQTFSLNDQQNIQWGTSQWVVLPGTTYSSFQMQEYNNYFRIFLIRANYDSSVASDFSVIKLQINPFDPHQGTRYSNLGVDGNQFVTARWKKQMLYMVYGWRNIKSLDSSTGNIVQTLNIENNVVYMQPYGPKSMIGFALAANSSDLAVIDFEINTQKALYVKQTFRIRSTVYSQPAVGAINWNFHQAYQLDWQNKRITIPLQGGYRNDANSPPVFLKGYYQIYANPNQKCMSALPVSTPCSTADLVQAPLKGKINKHWDDSPDFIYATSNDVSFNGGPTQRITGSSTIVQNNQSILITKSDCQIQARIIVDRTQNPADPKPVNSEVSYVDLCP